MKRVLLDKDNNKIIKINFKKEGTQDTANPTRFDITDVTIQTETTGSSVVLPSTDEVVSIVNQLKDTIFDTKYTIVNTVDTTLPSAADLNTKYTTNGINVEDLQGNSVILASASAGVPNSIEAQLNDGILITLTTNGVFEEAGYTAAGWVIDQTKNTLPTELKNLDERISINEGDISNHETRIANVEAELEDTTGDALKKSNNKDVVSKGSIAAGDVTVTDPNKLLVREDMRSAMAHLGKDTKTLTELEDEQDAQGVRITQNEDQITVIDAEQIVQNNRLSALESNPAANYITAFRKWTGSQGGSATNPTDNKTDIDLSALIADDNAVFDFASGNDFTIWLEASVDNNPLEFNALVQSGRTTPQVLQSLRESQGNNLEIVYAILSTTGILTITRTSGDEIDFTTIQVNEISETVRTPATNLATKTELNATNTIAVAADTLSKTNQTNIASNVASLTAKQDKTDNSLTTTSKAVVGAINEVKGRVDNNESDIDEITNDGKIKADSGTRDLTLPNVVGTIPVIVATDNPNVTLTENDNYTIPNYATFDYTDLVIRVDSSGGETFFKTIKVHKGISGNYEISGGDGQNGVPSPTIMIVITGFIHITDNGAVRTDQIGAIETHNIRTNPALVANTDAITVKLVKYYGYKL